MGGKTYDEQVEVENRRVERQRADMEKQLRDTLTDRLRFDSREIAEKTKAAMSAKISTEVTEDVLDAMLKEATSGAIALASARDKTLAVAERAAAAEERIADALERIADRNGKPVVVLVPSDLDHDRLRELMDSINALL